MSELTTSPDTLSPLPSEVRNGLTAVSVLASMSLAASVTLFGILLYQIVRRSLNRNAYKSGHTPQFTWLIVNLLLADIQQACAFIINAHWIAIDQIAVGTTACWAQGWFVSTGDLASGVWCFSIAVHTFAGIIFNYKLSMRWFYVAMALLWIFVYSMAIIAVGLYGNEVYVRAGAWV